MPTHILAHLAAQRTGDRFAAKRAKIFPPHDRNANFVSMDKLTKEQRRKNMQAVKATGSKIETAFAKALFARGHRYRKNDRTVFGKPDLTLKKSNLPFSLIVNFGTEKIGQNTNTTIRATKNFGTTKLSVTYSETRK